MNVYSSVKHHTDSISYFGILDLKSKEAKIYRHSDPSSPEKHTILKLKNLIDDHLKTLHTVVFPKYSEESLFLFSNTAIFVYDVKSKSISQRYTSFNLQPYNIQVINTKYLYF